MSTPLRRRALTIALTALVPVLAAGLVGFTQGPAGAAGPPTASISGSGSSWAYGAVYPWTQAAYTNNGLVVNYNTDGDAAGRQDFANKVSTFSVTSEGFQGGSDTSQGRAYAYLPIAAGGTSFPYQIRVDGQQVENLRLSGQTLAKIFTNQITNWDDPEITADNNGQALPSLPIIPVVQSEGSGSTYQLTNWLSSQYPGIWNPFAGTPGPTEYFPRQGNEIAQNGSDAAINYVTSSEANGAIGYVEYFYPLQVGYPVAKVLNSAGYYTLPTQYNVAVSLEQAQINMDQSSPNYLLQNLSNVYTDTDPRTYALSSYVYLIEPTGGANDSAVSPGMAQTLADFEYYDICQGQAGIGAFGYSPLPVNLVEAAFGQVQKLQTGWPTIDISNLNITTCNNPTFVPGQPDENYLAQIAPLPPACDKQGAGPCAAGVTPNGIGPTPTSSGTVPGVAAASGTAGSAAGGAGAAGTTKGSTAAAGTQQKGATGSGVAQSIGALDAHASSSPTVHGAVLPVAAAASFLDRIAPWAVVPLLILFALPLVIGLRRARARAGAASGPEGDPGS